MYSYLAKMGEGALAWLFTSSPSEPHQAHCSFFHLLLAKSPAAAVWRMALTETKIVVYHIGGLCSAVLCGRYTALPQCSRLGVRCAG